MISSSVWSLAIDPTTPATLSVGTDYRLHKSTNGGLNWAAIQNDLVDSDIAALAIDPSNPDTVSVRLPIPGFGLPA
jgi:hypothetical protein